MLTRPTLINLVAVGLASAALLLYGSTQLLAGLMFDPTYPVRVVLPETGALRADKQVTYNGAAVGSVADVELVDDRVAVSMDIDEGVDIPVDTDVVVLRSSPVGEQALDLRPVGDGDGPYVEPGSTIEPREVVLPTEIQPLLELAAEVFEPVDADQAGEVVSELADAVRGRRDDVRGFLADSADLSETIADQGDDYDRFFAASRRVNAALADNRETLGRLIGEVGAATAILRDVRADYEALLTTGPPVLGQVGDVVHRGQANLSCSLRDLAALNAYLAQDQQLADAAEALRTNQFFFEGFNTFTQEDARGHHWQRIHLVAEPVPPAQSYLPDKRPIPATRPGGACDSPFGEGAPMAVQDDFALSVPDGTVNEPDDDRATPVRREPLADARAPARPGGDGDDGAATDRRPSGGERAGRDDVAGGPGSDPGSGSDPAPEPAPGPAGGGVAATVLALGAVAVLAAGWGVARATIRSRRETTGEQ